MSSPMPDYSEPDLDFLTDTCWIPLSNIEHEVMENRHRWGIQNHQPQSGLGLAPLLARLSYENAMFHTKDQVKREDDRGFLGWDLILLEEVYEALCEANPRRIREELVQVCAVAVAWMEQLDAEIAKGGE